MTTNEAKTLAKGHWPNLVVVCIGAAVIAFGAQNPEQSSDLLNKGMQFVLQLIGILMTGGGILNSARMGVKQEVQGVKEEVQRISPAPPGLASTVAGEVTSSLASNLMTVQTSLLHLHNAVNEKHEENGDRHEALLAAVQEDKRSNDEQHAEHRRNIAEIKNDLAEGRQEFVKINSRLDEVATALRNGAK